MTAGQETGENIFLFFKNYIIKKIKSFHGICCPPVLKPADDDNEEGGDADDDAAVNGDAGSITWFRIPFLKTYLYDGILKNQINTERCTDTNTRTSCRYRSRRMAAASFGSAHALTGIRWFRRAVNGGIPDRGFPLFTAVSNTRITTMNVD
ncbi:MAG: hypothetical protein IKO41_11390 [Lachnospiraceae bacterium]|nr:hypothetical protein [Lachnospiraceae bacterium]